MSFIQYRFMLWMVCNGLDELGVRSYFYVCELLKVGFDSTNTRRARFFLRDFEALTTLA